MDIILELVQKICAHMGGIVPQQPAAGYWRSRSADFGAGCLNSYDILLQFTPTPVFEKFLFDKGANCNRDCPFKVAFGEGQSLRPHNCIGSTPISGVIGVGVKSNDIFIVCFNNIKYALDKWDRIAYNNIRT